MSLFVIAVTVVSGAVVRDWTQVRIQDFDEGGPAEFDPREGP